METSTVTNDNIRVLTVKLGRQTCLAPRSIGKRSKHSFSCCPSEFAIVQHSPTHHDVVNFLFGDHLDSHKHRLPLNPNCFAWIQKNKARSQPKSKQFRHDSSQNIVTLNKCMSAMTSQHGGGHSFFGSNRKKRCPKWRTFNFENVHSFWTLFVTFERQNLLFLAFYLKSKLSQ